MPQPPPGLPPGRIRAGAAGVDDYWIRRFRLVAATGPAGVAPELPRAAIRRQWLAPSAPHAAHIPGLTGIRLGRPSPAPARKEGTTMTTVLRAALPLAARLGAGGPVPRAAAGARRAARPLITRVIPVSATLAANEAMAARRARGEPVLPLAFGEAGLPVHPALRDALAAAAASQQLRPGSRAGGAAGRPPPGTGPGAACRPAPARWSAARAASRCCSPCCWPSAATSPCRGPSWVSYAAQAAMTGTRPHFVPAPAGEGGIPDPDALAAAATAAAAGRAADPVGGGDPARQPDRPGWRPRPRSRRCARSPPPMGWSSSATRSTGTWCTTRPRPS